MTRRVSKREMLHRLDSTPYARVHLDSLRCGSARVMVERVTCAVNFPRQARHELMRPNGIYCNLDSIPGAIGDGYMPPGTNSGSFARGMRRSTEALPTVKVYDSFSEHQEQAFERFLRSHPVGSIVAGSVILRNRKVAILDLGLGLGIRGRLDKGGCLDHTAGSPVKWLPLPQLGDRVDVLIRRFIPNMKEVSVTLHSFERDTGFCNQAAGYRSGFNAAHACFTKLPWEKTRAAQS